MFGCVDSFLDDICVVCYLYYYPKDTDERAKLIHELGCVQAGEEWMEHNLILLASSAIILAFLQVLL